MTRCCQRLAPWLGIVIAIVLIGVAQGATITVGPSGADYANIQDAVDAASPGDTIIVNDGTYIDSANVGTHHLTIKSANGNASTIFWAEHPDDHVFEVNADYVTISGFAVNGATGTARAGIFLANADHCTISGNTASLNYDYGIYLVDSSYNIISGNTASSNDCGIYLEDSSDNIISSNTASSNYDGIYLEDSSDNIISGNTASSNYFGIELYGSSNNWVYNNRFFDNVWNAWERYDNGNNRWNVLKTHGKNIIGGSWMGGNSWSNYDGRDIDGDGLGDTGLPYNSDGWITTGGDGHPLCDVGYDPRIAVDKTGNLTEGAPSTNVNFTITVTNTGNCALNVTAVDTIPTGMSYVSSTGGGLQSPAGTVTWDLDTLAASESATVYLVAHVDTGATGELNNTVQVEGEPPQGNNVTDEGYHVVNALQPGISVTKEGNVSEGAPCTNVNFTITVTNTGDCALNVTAVDTIPAGMSYVSSTGGGLQSPAGTVTWDLDTLAASESAIVYLVAHVDTGTTGELNNTVLVEGEPPQGNNVTDEGYHVVNALQPGISVTKEGNVSEGAPCTNVNFTITVTNTGDCALNVTAVDTIPAGMSYVSSTGGGTESPAGTVTWDLDTLAASESATVYLVAHVDTGATGELNNTVLVEGEPPHGNNVTDEGYHVVNALQPGISVIKEGNVTEGAPSTNVNFTITVTNTGDCALNVTAVDTIPAGMSYVSSTGGGTESPAGTVTWDLDTLAASESAIVYLVAHVDTGATGELNNTVLVEGEPPHGSNVTDEGYHVVNALYPGISVIKEGNVSEGAPCTNVNFTITVTNTGDCALNVTAVDTIPTGMSYVSSTDGGAEAPTGTVTWDLDTLAARESATVYLVAHVDTGATGELNNTVLVEGETLQGNNVTDEGYHVVTALYPGISVTKEGNVSEGAPSTNVNFTITVTNTGDCQLDPVAVVDTIPAGMSYVSDDSGGNIAGNTVTWDNLGPMTALESKAIHLVLHIDKGAEGELNNTVHVEGKPSHGDNVSDEAYETVTGLSSSINVTKTANKETVKRGDETSYIIEICNPSAAPVHNVVVRDVFDRTVEFVSASPMPGDDGTWRFDVIPVGDCVNINLTVKIPKLDLEFGMNQAISGEGFVNVANDYSTTLQPYILINRVYVTSDETPEISTSESLTVVGDPGTELSTREHGSGTYESEEQVRMLTENKSVSMDKDVSANYEPTSLGLYRNRTLEHSSLWTEEARAKNRITGSTMREQYQHATTIDRESRFDLDQNGSTMEFDTEFEGTGHVGILDTSTSGTTPHLSARPGFESSEDYTGSFRIYRKADQYGSSVTSEKSASGSGYVASDTRIKDSQRSYEYGTGDYESEEMVSTSSNYIDKNISLAHRPSSFKIGGETWSNQSMKWKEGIWSNNPGTSFIGEEYTSIDSLEKDTVARGLNEMETEAEFSGEASYKVQFKDIVNKTELRGGVDFEENYIGDYSIERHVLFHGIPKYDHPHMAVSKSGELHYEDGTVLARYSITVENDGNRALGPPIYVKDFFPPRATYINASIRPSELTSTSANWTLTHLAIGDRSNIELWLNVTEYAGDELVNRVEASGAYNETWVTATNFTALEINWLTCCLERTVSVTKAAELDPSRENVVKYTLTIQNLDDTTRVARVTDPLPEGMGLLYASVPPSAADDGVLIWNLIDLGPNETETIVYETEASWSGTFLNRAEVDISSVNGTIQPTQYGTAIIYVGLLDEQESAQGWQPPDWGFNLTCEEGCDLGD